MPMGIAAVGRAHGEHSVGVAWIGDAHRVTVMGPGVTPDVQWQGPGLHPFNRGNPSDVALESAMNAERDSIRSGYGKCDHD